ncbi:unnamed protein product [Polarella glacialis]|uniref:Uncharacterized protein n=1 Tax=Polarella glacialis TaxID=89957 RepID=A0A813J459_POLGL|nr:unnamed protein product [Polarella glacialis]
MPQLNTHTNTNTTHTHTHTHTHLTTNKLSKLQHSSQNVHFVWLSVVLLVLFRQQLCFIVVVFLLLLCFKEHCCVLLVVGLACALRVCELQVALKALAVPATHRSAVAVAVVVAARGLTHRCEFDCLFPG